MKKQEILETIEKKGMVEVQSGVWIMDLETMKSEITFDERKDLPWWANYFISTNNGIFEQFETLDDAIEWAGREKE